MLKIRLQRIGKKHAPTYRVVVVESHRGPKSAAVQEIVGNYNPRTKDLVLKNDRIEHWTSVGAQKSETVENLIKRGSDWKPKEKTKISKKAKAKAEAPAEEPKAEAPADSPEKSPEGDSSGGDAPAQEAPKEDAPAEEAPKEEEKVEAKVA